MSTPSGKLPLASSATSPSKPTAKILKDYAAGSLGEPLTLTGHTSYVTCFAMLPDGRLVSGSSDNTLKTWDVDSLQCLTTPSEHMYGIWCLAVLPDGRLVSGSADNTLKIWDVASLQWLARLTEHSNWVRCLTVLPDGRLVSGSFDNTLKIWNVTSLQCLATLLGHSNGVRCLSLLPDGRLVSGASDKTLKIWDVASLQCLATLSGHTDSVLCLTILPDGRLVSGSADNTLKIWDVASQQCLATLSGHTDSVWCISLLPDGRLVSGSDDGTLKIWDVTSLQCLATLSGRSNGVRCLTVLPDGRLVSGSYQEIKIWDFPLLSDTPLPAVAISSDAPAAIVPQPDIARPSLPTQEKATPQPLVNKASLAKFSLPELLKACREEASFEIAKQVLQEKLPTLKKLDLSNAQLTATDIATLVEVVENPAQPLLLILQHVNISQNAIGHEGLIALFPLLQRVCNTLQELNLSHCGLTDKSLLGFIKNCLPELTKLFALDMTGNTFSEKTKTMLQAKCDEKMIALDVDNSLTETLSSHSSSSQKESAVPSMPWGGRELFFPKPTPEEQAQLRAELEGYAPSVSGGSHYTSQTARYVDFHSEDPLLIAEALRSCIVLECTKGTIDVHNSLTEEKTIITFSKIPAEQSKNTALIKTFEQLRIPLTLKSGTAAVSWRDLKSRHVNLCISIFKAYHQGIASVEGVVTLGTEQMEVVLKNVEKNLLAEMRELRETQEEIARDTKTGLALQMPPSYHQ
jgi:WD40 repeat protein